MSALALVLTLTAAVVHAGWNLLLSDAEDSQAAAAVAVCAGAVVFAPVAALTWRVHGAALPYVAASSVLELLYLAFLAAGYARAEMSFVYPVARGSGPVFVLLITVLVLGGHVSALAAVGVLGIAAGVVLVRGLRAAGHRRDLVLALAVGASIAGYTLIDKHGLAHAGPLPYLELAFIPTSLGYLATAYRSRGAPALRAALTPATVVAGVGFFGAYALVLAALTHASAPSVAAVRETSVLIAVAYLAVRGREPVAVTRLLGSALVVAGIAAVALG